MAKDRQIQELEIKVLTTGADAAEAKLNRLDKRKDRWEKEFNKSRADKTKREKLISDKKINERKSQFEKEFNIMRKEKSSREEKFRSNKAMNRKEDWEAAFRQKRAAKISRERTFNLKREIKDRMGSGRGAGYSSLDSYRGKSLTEKRKADWESQFNTMRAEKTARTQAFLQGKKDARPVDWERQFNEMRAEKTARSNRAKRYQEMKSSTSKSIKVSDILEGTAVESQKRASMFATHKATRKTNKELLERIRIEKLVKKHTKSSNKEIKKSTGGGSGHGAGRRSGGGFVGSAMLYLGAATMAQYMVGSAVGATFALGDIAATVESDVLKGQAFRQRYSEKNDVSEFDNAVNLYSRLSGQSQYLAQSQMAQIAGSLEAAGVDLKGDQLTGIARATRGLSGGMGISEDMASQKILGLLSGRISAQEAGLVGVKRSSDPSKTLESILKFMEKNAVTASVMKEGTMSSLMARIRTAPLGLIASLSEQMPEQMKHGVEVFADWVDGFFGTGDDEVTDAWKRTMKQFEEMSVQVFGDGAGDMSVGIAKAVAAGIKTIELAARGTKNTIDVINDTIELAETLIDTRIIESGGTKTADRVIVDMISEPVDNFLAMVGKGGRELGGQSIDFMGRSINEGNDALDDYFKSKLKGLIHNPEQVEGRDEFGIKAGGQTINYNIGTAVIGENHELSLDHDIMSEGGVN